MIAIDTSSLIAYLAGASGRDVAAVDQAFEEKYAVIAPVVLTELLSAKNLSPETTLLFRRLPLLDLMPGFWERAGRSRSKILSRGHRARLADTLIAQCCIDHGIGLVTRDNDFQKFAKFCKLELV